MTMHRCVRIHRHDIQPAIAIEVQPGKGTAVSGMIQSRDARKVSEHGVASRRRCLREQMVPFAPALRNAILEIASGGIESWQILHPFDSETIICAHDRAPPVTSDVHIRVTGRRRGVVTAQRVEIEVPVVRHVAPLRTP